MAAVADSGETFATLFRTLDVNDTTLPGAAPPALQAFFAGATRVGMLDGVAVDHARLARGEDVFMTHACSASLALLAMSLPAGYAAPNLAQILVMSGNLETHPYKRLLGVLQMVVNVTARGGFEPAGSAVVTAAKLRLLHAGVRRLVRRRMPSYDERYGVPVNHEDMLATIMGFSLLVVRGLQRLGVPLDERDAEDYYYLWRIFAWSMGIRPVDAPNSLALIPATLADADVFYAAYARRHYRLAAENPEGVELTRANVLMLAHMVAETPLKLAGPTVVPRLFMQQFLGVDGLVARGVTPVRFHGALMRILLGAVRVWTQLWGTVDRDGAMHVHEQLSQWLFHGLIDRTLHGEVTFLVPERWSDLHDLTENIMRPFGERRRGPRRSGHGDAPSAERRSGRDRRLAFRQRYWGLDRTRGEAPIPAARQ